MKKKGWPKEELAYSVRVKPDMISSTHSEAHSSPRSSLSGCLRNPAATGPRDEANSTPLVSRTRFRTTREHRARRNTGTPPTTTYHGTTRVGHYLLLYTSGNQYPHEPACTHTTPYYTSNHHNITQVNPGEVSQGTGNELIHKFSQKE